MARTNADPSKKSLEAACAAGAGSDINTALVWRDAQVASAKRDELLAKLKAAQTALKWAEKTRASQEMETNRVKKLMESGASSDREVKAAEVALFPLQADEDEARNRVEIVKSRLARACAHATYAESRLTEVREDLTASEKAKLESLDKSFKKSTAGFV